jgi:hypothetical protein
MLCHAQPFVDQDHPFQSLFPDWTYAIKVPALLFVVRAATCLVFLCLLVTTWKWLGQVFMTGVTTFISLVMIKSRRPKTMP